jgi:hypothetical protein
MKTIIATVTAIGALGAGLTAAAPAQAQVEFAAFSPAGGLVNFRESGGTLESLSATTPAVFAFDLTPLADFGELKSTFDFTASPAGGATDAGGVIAATYSGSFSYDYIGPTVTRGGVTLTHGELLLGGTFSDASFSGAAGSSGAGLQDDGITGTVTYTTELSSTELPLAASGGSFSLAFLDLSPILALAASGGHMRDFLATGGGMFATNLTTGGGGGGVPEPAGWALMLVGFGAVGAILRRDRTAIA